jgi:hypothetical protein
VAQEIRVELSENYPDYQFYLCSYKIKVVPNPNPPHPSRPTMIVKLPESFEQKPIELPFNQTINSLVEYRGGKLSEKVFWLVAIKKSQAQELEPKIKSAVLDSSVEGIKKKALEDSIYDLKNERKVVKVVVNKVSMDEKEIKLKVEAGEASAGSFSCLGVGLFLVGLVLIGGWRLKKASI